MADEVGKAATSAEKAYADAALAVTGQAATGKPVPAEKAAKAPAAITPQATSLEPAIKAARPATKSKVVATPKAQPKPRVQKPGVPKSGAKALAKAKLPPKKKAAATATALKAAPKSNKKTTRETAAEKPAKTKQKASFLFTPISQIKETVMSKTPDFTKTVSEAVSEIQTRAKEAYEKSTSLAGEASEFTKGNVEAIVESGKILSSGIQDLGKTYVEEAKSAFETLTADLKEIAAIKSPTELFQLQGKLIRRNFDSAVAFGSKNSEAVIKLANESIAPISSRLSLAADKVSKASA